MTEKASRVRQPMDHSLARIEIDGAVLIGARATFVSRLTA